MNKNVILYSVLGLGIATAGFFVYRAQNPKEEVYQLTNGESGTAEELIARGYMPIQVGSNINWVLKSEYEKQMQNTGGSRSALVIALEAAGALFGIASTTIREIQNR